MLSHRTAAALLAYAATGGPGGPASGLRAPKSCLPSYTAFHWQLGESIERAYRFVELDLVSWTVPRVRVTRALLDVVVVWFAVQDDDDVHLCSCTIDLAAFDPDDLALRDGRVSIPRAWLHRDAALARWVGAPVSGARSPPATALPWRIVRLDAAPEREQLRRVAHRARGPLPRV
jgi:hypothetical protein